MDELPREDRQMLERLREAALDRPFRIDDFQQAVASLSAKLRLAAHWEQQAYRRAIQQIDWSGADPRVGQALDALLDILDRPQAEDQAALDGDPTTDDIPPTPGA